MRIIKKIIFCSFDYFVLWASNVPAQRKGKLYIRLDAIGDCVLWVNALTRTLSRHDVEDTTLVCAPDTYPFIKSQGIFFNIIIVDPRIFARSLRYRRRVLRDVSSLAPEIAIQPTYSRVLLTGDSIIRASRARIRVGVDGDLANRSQLDQWIGDRWYTSLLKTVVPVHWEGYRNLEFMQSVKSHFHDLNSSAHALENISSVNTCDAIAGGILIFPGSGSHKKMWPAKKYAELISGLKKIYSNKIYVCGTESEQALGHILCSGEDRERVVNLVGKTDWADLMRRISAADLIIGNDSACVHLASFFGIKSVSVLGGGQFGRFLPYPNDAPLISPKCIFHKMDCYGCDWKCTQQHASVDPYPCVEFVAVNNVLRMAGELLKV
jgi:ADP-heptose:LPS heptosyltransferase